MNNIKVKMFKNLAWIGGDSSERDEWIVSDGPRSRFSREEWDMEVTFIKKVPKIVIGSKVRSKWLTTYLYTVVGQYENRVIVVDENDDEIEIFDRADLILENDHSDLSSSWG